MQAVDKVSDVEPNEQPAPDVSPSSPARAVLVRALVRSIKWASQNPETAAAVLGGAIVGVNAALAVARFYSARKPTRTATVEPAQPGEVVKPAVYTVKP